MVACGFGGIKRKTAVLMMGFKCPLEISNIFGEKRALRAPQTTLRLSTRLGRLRASSQPLAFPCPVGTSLLSGQASGTTGLAVGPEEGWVESPRSWLVAETTFRQCSPSIPLGRRPPSAPSTTLTQGSLHMQERGR